MKGLPFSGATLFFQGHKSIARSVKIFFFYWLFLCFILHLQSLSQTFRMVPEGGNKI
jgi:hypothetical protein